MDKKNENKKPLLKDWFGENIGKNLWNFGVYIYALAVIIAYAFYLRGSTSEPTFIEILLGGLLFSIFTYWAWLGAKSSQ